MKININILLFLVIFAVSSLDTYACQEDDYVALRALYLNTDGDNWTDNTGWLNAATFTANPIMPPGTDVSAWKGVAVDGSGCVTKLNLPFNNLNGIIPPELGNLSNLKELLWLDDNQLSGNIPVELGNLSNLQWLSLYRNQLTGSIPTELGNLSNLEWLNLSENQLSGTIPLELGNLSNLIALELEDNQLSGSIPPELGNLSNLYYYLHLSNNQLSGSIPPELGNLSNLNGLYLSNNQLSGSIPIELGNSNLSDLFLSNNQLSGSIPSELSNLSNLGWLFLDANQLSGSIPLELGNLSNLEWLDLSANQLSGSIPSELSNLNNLWTLKLNNNELSGCYDIALMSLCDQLNGTNGIINSINAYISDGNTFDAPWEDFCATETGECSLPIELSEPLQASIKNKTTILTWKTMTETNNKGFEIQKSDDGVSWENIGWQPGQGNSLTPQTYTYTGTKPRLGINYYRFKQIDFDGNFSYSNIVSIHHKVDRVTVYPVPSKDFVVFDVPNITAADEIILYDIIGKQISRQTFPQDKRLAVSHLNDGVYIYRIFYEGEMYSGKIVVEKT